MSKQDWTIEPWCVVRDPSHFHSLSSVVGDERDGLPLPVAEFTGQTVRQQEANAIRAVHCVNALAGIPDPAAYVKAMRDVCEAAEEFYEDGGTRRLYAALDALRTLATPKSEVKRG